MREYETEAARSFYQFAIDFNKYIKDESIEVMKSLGRAKEVLVVTPRIIRSNETSRLNRQILKPI